MTCGSDESSEKAGANVPVVSKIFRGGRRRWARGILATSVAGVCVVAPLAACQVIAGIENRSTPATSVVVDAPVVDAPTSDASAASCALEHFETARSDVDASPDDYDETIVAAFRMVRLPGTRDASADDFPGYDLDNVCTCCDGDCSAANLPTCVSASPAAPVACDGVGGVDNAGAALIDLDPHFSAAKINAAIASGTSTILLQVRHWNGFAADDSVDIAFLNSPGATGPDGGLLGDAGVPKFDGTDTWSYASDSVMGDTPDGQAPTDYPALHSDQAYIADGYLYARVSALYIVLESLPLHLTDVAISGQIQANGGKNYSVVGGVFSARWATSDALLQLGAPALDHCDMDGGGSEPYRLLKSALCSAADLTSDPKRGGNGIAPPTNACDALSMQFNFETTHASFSGPLPPLVPSPPCPSFSDNCP